MSYKLSAIALAVLAVASASASAADAEASMFSFSGFGTVGVTRSSETNADFITHQFQPNGAGVTHQTSTSTDTRLGGQVTANINSQLSAVLQVVTEQNWDNTWTPHVEWANVKYAITPDFSVRVGRTALPGFMASDYRKVGYALPWVRPPVEPYSTMSVTSSDGIDATYRHRFGDISNSTTVFYGKTKSTFPIGTPDGSDMDARNIMGITDAVEFGSTTLRASYFQADLTFPRVKALSAIPLPPYQAMAKMGDDKTYKFYQLGAMYDPGNWFVTGELVKTDYVMAGNTQSGYVSAGYRYGKFTPYATYSQVKQMTAPGLVTLPSVNQKNTSVGVRWDFMKNADFKLQFDHLTAGAGSPGTLVNPTPSFKTGNSSNLISAVVDFVF